MNEYPNIENSIKRYIAQDVEETSNEEWIRFLANSAVDYANAICKQPLVQKEYFFWAQLNQEQGKMLIPFSVPFTVSLVQEYMDEFSAPVEFDSDNYIVLVIGSSRNSRFVWKNANPDKLYKVTGLCGYAESNIDTALLLVLCEMAATVNKESANGGNRLGISTESKNLGSATLTTSIVELLSRFNGKLKPWRMPTV